MKRSRSSLVPKGNEMMAGKGEWRNKGREFSLEKIQRAIIPFGPRRQGAKLQAEIVENVMWISNLKHKWKRKVIMLKLLKENLKNFPLLPERRGSRGEKERILQGILTEHMQKIFPKTSWHRVN
jgi:hypothetical protein